MSQTCTYTKEKEVKLEMKSKATSLTKYKKEVCTLDEIKDYLFSITNYFYFEGSEVRDEIKDYLFSITNYFYFY